MTYYPTFARAIESLGQMLWRGRLVHTEKWQGLDISAKPEMATYEILNATLQVPVWTGRLELLAKDIGPNLPWADDAFLERVGGHPLNPGEEWKRWPWAHSAARFVADEVFDHTYAERYWPKFGGDTHARKGVAMDSVLAAHRGIRFAYGDLNDVVSLLHREPLTRQAYMPMWFPEDTGVTHGGRVPCSLGYHFIVRDGSMHVAYYIRSCDYKRHFRDDCYMTVRLLLWVLDRLRELDPKWADVRPGLFTMHVTSLHVFAADFKGVFGFSPP